MISLNKIYDNRYSTNLLKAKSDNRFSKTLSQLTDYVDVKENWTMLDIGCGKGTFLKYCPFKKKYGIDFSNVAISSAKKLDLRVFVCDIESERLPFKDSSIDLIFCLEVFEHIFDEVHIMNEIKRVLKPTGIIYVSVPNEVLKYDKRLRILFGSFIFQCAEYAHECLHIRFFDSKRLRTLFERHDFKIIYNGAIPLSYKKHSFGKIGRFLSDNFPDLLSTTYSIICQNARTK